MLDVDQPLHGSIFIDIQGLQKIKKSVVLGECGDVTKSNTVRELHNSLIDTQNKLLELGVIKSVSPLVDFDGENIIVSLRVTEQPPSYSFGANQNRRMEPSFELKAEVPGIAGSCTCLSASTQSPTFKWFNSHESSLRLSTSRFSLLGSRWCNASFDMVSAKTDMQKYSSYTEALQAVNCSLQSGNHSINIETYSLRDLIPTLPTASSAIQSARQRSIKTSLKYSYSRITDWGARRFEVEGAGLWGDVRFLKAEEVLNYGPLTVPLPQSITGSSEPRDIQFSLTAASGLLLPLDGKETCIQDRFFLGGASGCSSVLKGFVFRGAARSDARNGPATGPNAAGDKHDAIGGNAFASVMGTASHTARFPGTSLQGTVFLFANAGLLGSPGMSEVRNLKPSIQNGKELCRSVRSSVRSSIGFGIAIPLPAGGHNAFVEATAALPFGYSNSDVLQRFQLGLRMQC